MNSLRKASLFKNVIKRNTFYQFTLRNKYRRDSQPGLTRYNYDSLNYEQMPYEVSVK